MFSKVLSVVGLLAAVMFGPAMAETLTYTPSLPTGYEALEYVESDGTQTMNTGYQPRRNDCVWLKAMPKATDTTYFCARGNNGGYYELIMLPARTLRFDSYDGTSGRTFTTTRQQSINMVYTMTCDFQYGNVYVDGEKWVSGQMANPGSGSTPSHLWLFALLDAAAAPDTIKSRMSLRYYAFKVWHNNGYLTLDLVPCRETATSAVGFYDRVGGRFIGPTEGTLIAGPAAAPHTIRRLQYVKTIGSQFIDTGYRPWGSDIVSMDVAIADGDRGTGAEPGAR